MLVSTPVTAVPVTAEPAAATESLAESDVTRAGVGDVELPEVDVAVPGRVEELMDLRTESSKTFVLDDGSYETELFAGPIHRSDGEDGWVDVSSVPVLVDGVWQAESVLGRVRSRRWRRGR